MLSRAHIWLVALVIVLLPLSCSRIERPPPAGEEAVAEQLPALNAIPLEWGNLISVSRPPGESLWLLLTFQDEAGTIRIVFYNAVDELLSADVRVIGRS
jgi:hypothetical protein